MVRTCERCGSPRGGRGRVPVARSDVVAARQTGGREHARRRLSPHRTTKPTPRAGAACALATASNFPREWRIHVMKCSSVPHDVRTITFKKTFTKRSSGIEMRSNPRAKKRYRRVRKGARFCETVGFRNAASGCPVRRRAGASRSPPSSVFWGCDEHRQNACSARVEYINT